MATSLKFFQVTICICPGCCAIVWCSDEIHDLKREHILEKMIREEVNMLVYFNPNVHLLLLTESFGKVRVLYNDNPRAFQLPSIGVRPPYYTNPRYEAYYPIL